MLFRKYITLTVAAIAMFGVSARAQITPPAVAAYLSPSAGVWSPWTSTGGFGSILVTPQAVGLYCQASAGAPWQPCAPSSGGGNGGGVQIGGDIGGTNAAPVVTGIQGKAVAATAPTDGQVQIWNASSNEYVPGPVVAAPAVAVEFYPAAVSDGGTAFAAAWTRYDNNEPQTGSINPAASAQGYMAFQAAPVLPQYAELTVSEPGYWTGTGISIDFFSAATTGNVTWEVQAVCIAAGTALTSSYSPTFSTPVALTTAVSSTSNGLVTTATASNLISPGTGSCPSSPTTPTKVTFRIYRAASDTAAGNANLLGATLLTGRSQ